jgi:hypothetical protein
MSTTPPQRVIIISGFAILVALALLIQIGIKAEAEAGLSDEMAINSEG